MTHDSVIVGRVTCLPLLGLRKDCSRSLENYVIHSKGNATDIDKSMLSYSFIVWTSSVKVLLSGQFIWKKGMICSKWGTCLLFTCIILVFLIWLSNDCIWFVIIRKKHSEAWVFAKYFGTELCSKCTFSFILVVYMFSTIFMKSWGLRWKVLWYTCLSLVPEWFRFKEMWFILLWSLL